MQPIDLSYFFTTKTQANDFLGSLTTIAEMFFRTNFNFENALVQELGVNKADRFLAIMRQNNVNPESLPMVKEFVTILTQKIMTMPVITLTVAFEPQEQTLRDVSEWFVINTKKQMLFDVKVDRSIIAGATITYNGKFSDFSIREIFEHVLKNTLTIPETASQKPQPVQQNTSTQTPKSNTIPVVNQQHPTTQPAKIPAPQHAPSPIPQNPTPTQVTHEAKQPENNKN